MSKIINPNESLLITMLKDKLEELNSLINQFPNDNIMVITIVNDSCIVTGHGNNADIVVHLLDKVREDLLKRAGKEPGENSGLQAV